MGCPLAAMAFAITLTQAIRKAITQIHTQHDWRVFLAAYLDDISIVGPARHVDHITDTMGKALRDIGLQLQPTKCEAWTHLPAQATWTTITTTATPTLLKLNMQPAQIGRAHV